jgi:hypothetical protein
MGATKRTSTTGKNLCTDGRKLHRRPKIGAIGIDRQHGLPPNGPSGQEGHRRSLHSSDGVPSVQIWPSGQVLAMSQPLARATALSL